MKSKSRGNGQGTVYKRGNSWQVELCTYVGGVRRRAYKSGFTTKTAALAYVRELEKELKTKMHRQETISFVDLWEKLQQTQSFKQLSKDKQAAYRIAYNKCTCLQTLSDVRFATYDMQASIIQGLSYYPARDVRTLLNKAWELAMRMGCLETNHAPLLELPPIPKAKNAAFTPEQVKLISEADDPFKDVVMCMIEMGLRPIEMLSMTVEDVDFDKRISLGGRKANQDMPIAISHSAEPYLRRLCEAAGSGRICALSNDKFYESFYKFLSNAKVQDENDHTLTPYACRHTFVTQLTRKGIPQAMIQKAARHSSYKTTQGYTHLDVSDVLSAMDE